MSRTLTYNPAISRDNYIRLHGVWATMKPYTLDALDNIETNDIPKDYINVITMKYIPENVVMIMSIIQANYSKAKRCNFKRTILKLILNLRTTRDKMVYVIPLSATNDFDPLEVDRVLIDLKFIKTNVNGEVFYIGDYFGYSNPDKPKCSKFPKTILTTSKEQEEE